MNGLSVIIPSRTASNLLACIAAIRKHESDIRIFVVDDGLPDRSIIDGVTIDGRKPFCFSRNVNLGIQAAGEDDVILANDDTILESLGGFSRMHRFAAEHPEVGVISATTNVAGNPAQHRQGETGMRVLLRNTPGNSFPTVAFVCCFIPRSTINLVGLLDERFVPGCFEDNDYCRRVGIAGLKIGICDGCYVDHGSLRSTLRGDPRAAADIEPARAIYLAKWGSM